MADVSKVPGISTKRTIGTTSVSGAAGAVAGVQVAQLVAEVFNLQLSTDALLGLATLLAGLAALLGGYISPSKGKQVQEVVDQATVNVPTYGDIQAMANSVAAHAANGAYAIRETPVSESDNQIKSEDDGIVIRSEVPIEVHEDSPYSVGESTPDLNAPDLSEETSTN